MGSSPSCDSDSLDTLIRGLKRIPKSNEQYDSDDDCRDQQNQSNQEFPPESDRVEWTVVNNIIREILDSGKTHIFLEAIL